MFMLLLKYGADINVLTKSGYSVYDLASQNKKTDILDIINGLYMEGRTKNGLEKIILVDPIKGC